MERKIIKREYNEHGVTYVECNDGYTRHMEYNEFGQRTLRKDNEGNFFIQDYDERGNQIHHLNEKGFEGWRKFDENNKELWYINSNGKLIKDGIVLAHDWEELEIFEKEDLYNEYKSEITK